ncbi:MAG: DUF948 domain-containing protein [Streptosporangiales bacterium]|nr:DUF948 domain-containing protein [Streptosporangiales bacterium]
MTTIGIAALIAAVSFAVLVLTVVIIAIRMSGIIGAAGKLLKETADGQESLIQQASAAIERTNATLDRTETVTSSMDKLGAGMNELSDQVNALSSFGRTMAGAVVSGPAGKAAAVAYGVKHAVVLRSKNSDKRTLPGQVVADTHPPRRAAASEQRVVQSDKRTAELPAAAPKRRSVRNKKKARQ